MNENKFSYVAGVLLVVLLVVVIYVGGKVNMLEEDVTNLYDRLDAIEGATLGYEEDYYGDLGYDEYYYDDQTAAIHDSLESEYRYEE